MAAGGKGAKSRKNVKHAQRKQAAKKAKRQLEKYIASLPKVSQNDLLAFQLSHFGDDTQPESWFVDPERAKHFENELEYEDDGLGYYNDGVKRTLTDQQIAVFQRTELWQLKRERERKEADAEECATVVPEHVVDHPRSPLSDASSLEEELLDYAARNHGRRQLQEPGLSAPRSASPASWKQRRSREQVPYDQRHKRKWEAFVAEVDDVEGSLTHRRIARELDDQPNTSVDMDY